MEKSHVKNLLPQRIGVMDQEMQEFEKDIEFLNTLPEKLQNMQQRRQKLEEYYQGNWIDDFEKYPNAMVGILSEDGLYNLFFEEQEARKNLLKKLIEQL